MKALLALTAILVAAYLPSSVAAQSAHREHGRLKYDFALVRKGERGMASWGSWDQSEQERLRSRGPGLYVQKDGKTYVITDADTVRKADQAIEEFKRTSKKLGGVRRAQKDERRTKEMAAQAKEQAELGRKINEAAEAYAKEVQEGDDPEAEARLKATMDELQAKMRNSSKSRKGWDSQAFGREMEQFGRQMEEAANATGQRIIGYIDEAFARGLAKPV